MPHLVLAAALVVAFLPVIAGGQSFFGRDLAPFFYPMKRYLADAVRGGRFPLWNPLVAGGEPFFASLQPGVLYPGSLLLYLLPFPHSVDWLIILHFAFAGVGWILLLRRLGRSPSAAAFGALAFVLGGFFMSLGNFVNNLQTMAWAPWLWLAWNRYRIDPGPRRLVVFAVACVAAFLGGEPQLLALTLALVFAAGLLDPVTGRVARGRQVTDFAAAGLLALLVAGVQLVPFVEFIGHSVRTMPLDLDFSAGRSQEAASLLHLLVPPALGAGEFGFTTRTFAAREVPWLLSLYPGIVVAGFVAVGFRTATRPERWFWGVLALLGVVFALGVHTPVYRAAFAALPPLRAFRYPEKFFLLPAMGIPFFAAAGFDRWKAHFDAPGRLAPGFLAVGAGYAVLAAWLFVRPGALGALCPGSGKELLLCGDAAAAGSIYAATSLRLALLAGAAAAVVVLARRDRLSGAAAAWVLVALAAFDLVAAHRAVNPSVESDIYTTTPWTAAVLGDEMDRGEEYRFRGSPVSAGMGERVRVTGAMEMSNMYLDLQALGPNAGELFGIQQQDGLQGVELRSVAMTHDAAIHDWAGDPVRYLRRMNVRWYADATASPGFSRRLREIARHPELPIRLFEVPEPLPRAFIATGWETAAGPGPALRRALAADLPDRRAVLERRPKAAAPGTARPPGRVVAATWTPERVRLIARSSAPGLLVLLDRWYPGWSVRVDGRPAELLRANGAFRAVEIPAGQADVEFVFRPRGVAIGSGLTAIGIAVCLVLLWWSRGRREAG
ncbi:MAG: hypothetical protein PVF05_08845 [Gemmatimonadales bacterium]